MIEKYVEIVGWDESITTNEQMNRYNIMQPLYDLMVEAGLSPVMGDIVTAFGLPGTAANTYCMPRMLSLRLETNLYMVLSFACTQNASSKACSVTQTGATSETFNNDNRNLYMAIIHDRRNEALGIEIVNVAQSNGATLTDFNTWATRGIKIVKGDKTTAINFIKKADGLSQHFDTVCITSIKYNNVDRKIVTYSRGNLAIYTRGDTNVLTSSSIQYLEYSISKGNIYTLIKGYLKYFEIENLDCSNLCRLELPTTYLQKLYTGVYNLLTAQTAININNEWYFILSSYITSCTYVTVIRM